MRKGRVYRNLHLLPALLFTACCIIFSLLYSEYITWDKKLTQAEKDAEGRFFMVEEAINKRCDVIRRLHALAEWVIPTDESTTAIATAMKDVQSSKSKQDTLSAYYSLIELERGILEALSSVDTISEKDSKLLISIKNNLVSANEQFEQAVEYYNEGSIMEDLYVSIPILQKIFKIRNLQEEILNEKINN